MAQAGDWRALGEYSLPVEANDGIYAFQDGTLHLSVDAGDSWDLASTEGLPAGGWWVEGATRDGRLLAFTPEEVFRQSADGGFESLGIVGGGDEWLEGLVDTEQGLIAITGAETGAPYWYAAQAYRYDAQVWEATGGGFIYSTPPEVSSLGGDDLFASFYVEPGIPSFSFSRDGGASWDRSSSFPLEYRFARIVLASGHVMAGYSGLALTEDAGVSWTIVGDPPPGIAVDAGHALLALARTRDPSQVLVSHSADQGMTWELMATVPVPEMGTASILDARVIGEDLFVTFPASGNSTYLYRSPVWLYTSAEPDAGIESTLAAFPNPTDDRAEISFSLTSVGKARLAVYDVLGREVTVLYDGPAASEVRVQTPNLPAGVYVAVLRTGERVETQRFTVVR
jgi:hypothetical protein